MTRRCDNLPLMGPEVASERCGVAYCINNDTEAFWTKLENSRLVSKIALSNRNVIGLIDCLDFRAGLSVVFC